jgi:L-fuconate dehydratase
LAEPLVGLHIEDLMADFGRIQRKISDHPRYRWLGPHKGSVHLALASITNACFDLWAKARGLPLWELLLSLKTPELVALLDLSYLEDVLTAAEAAQLIDQHVGTRADRAGVLASGYPGYDTSVGWFNYSDEQIRENVKRAIGQGFTAMKLKVGSQDPQRDIRRTRLVRETAGGSARIMIDANQQWSLPAARNICRELLDLDLYWVEEPTHPDDVLGHQMLAREIAPTRIAIGEHVPNRVLFKNFMLAKAAEFIQVDAVRVGGVSEFIVVSLMARKFGLRVVPHVGDMGQIHQHLVLFNHIALGHEKLFLECIPHLRDRFVHPACVEGGVYRTPREPGSSADLI